MTAKHKRITAVISQKKGRDYYYIIVSYYLSNGKRVQRWIKTEFPINGNNKRKLEQKRIEVLQEWQDKLVLDESEMLFLIISSNGLKKPNIPFQRIHIIVISKLFTM